jgi:MutS domain V
MIISEKYEQLKEQYQKQYEATQKTTNIIAGLRLFVIFLLIYSVYYFYKTEQTSALIGVGILLFAVFLMLVSWHLKYKEKAQLYQYLTLINEHEIGYLKGILKPFKAGENYIQTNHNYTYDLDIFGKNSVFQHINRTTTAIGETHLAAWLNGETPIDILAQQKAIKELGLKLDWRQQYAAIGQLNIDEDLDIPKFKEWLNYRISDFGFRVSEGDTQKSEIRNPKLTILRGVSYILPAITIGILIANFVSNDPIFFSLFKLLFGLNLIVVATQQKHIKEEHRLLSNTSGVLKKYSKLLQTIENEPFESDLLRGIVERNSCSANQIGSNSIHKLSKILNQFDTILNPFAAILMNGLFQYHLHALFTLEKWKIDNKKAVFEWFETIGTFEALSSIANFAYNNPDFIFPEITTEAKMVLKEVGHPLIRREKRICNDVSFDKTKFIVLTGSNMSGKSTFLRTLGVNLILTKIGSPVCAERFECYPFDVCVSMRIDDSLQNSESLFFAELKRLKGIIETLDKTHKTFIILDEILRGTNSNDKRAGTQGLIHRLIAKNAVGIIATHDLVIGDMKAEYPNYLSNQCFEATITDDVLHFDYKLREGVCQQMSAAFLMRKMDII